MSNTAPRLLGPSEAVEALVAHFFESASHDVLDFSDVQYLCEKLNRKLSLMFSCDSDRTLMILERPDHKTVHVAYLASSRHGAIRRQARAITIMAVNVGATRITAKTALPGINRLLKRLCARSRYNNNHFELEVDLWDSKAAAK